MKVASDSRKERKCWDIDEDVSFLKEQYRRYALVTHQRHIDKLNLSNGDTMLFPATGFYGRNVLGEGFKVLTQRYDLTKDIEEKKYLFS